MLAAVALLAACTYQPRLQDDIQSVIPDSIELAATPFFPQEQYQCGPAALATVLGYSGILITPQQLISRIYLPERHGSLQAELVATARQLGRMPYVIDPEIAAIFAELEAGRPVLVLQNLGLKSLPVWHYAVVIGYDKSKDVLLLRSGTHKRLQQSMQHFFHSWSGSGNWGVVMIKPGQLPASADIDRYLALVADLEEMQQYEMAALAYQAAAGYWPTAALPWFGMGNVHYQSENYEKAEYAYRKALSLDKNNVLIMNNLAMNLAERGCYQQARMFIKRAIDGAKKAQVLDLLQASKQTIDQYTDDDADICSQNR